MIGCRSNSDCPVGLDCSGPGDGVVPPYGQYCVVPGAPPLDASADDGCVPFVLPEDVLAVFEGEPRGVTVKDEVLYFSSNEHVFACPKSGCPDGAVAVSPAGVAPSEVTRYRADDVAWADTAYVRSCTVKGSAAGSPSRVTSVA